MIAGMMSSLLLCSNMTIATVVFGITNISIAQNSCSMRMILVMTTTMVTVMRTRMIVLLTIVLLLFPFGLLLLSLLVLLLLQT